LKLGRENVIERLLRFKRVYPKLKAMKTQAINSIDLRYTNGMAVAWSQGEE
jgi:cell division protein FtsQ